MKIKVYALITVLMAFAVSVYGREIGSSSPERQGFSSDQLDRLTQFMEAKVDEEPWLVAWASSLAMAR